MGAERLERLEFGIPVKEVPPTLMQVIGRKSTAILLKLMRTRLVREAQGIHAGLCWELMCLAEVAGFTSRNDIGPNRLAAGDSRNNVVKSQVFGRQLFPAVLTRKRIP